MIILYDTNIDGLFLLMLWLSDGWETRWIKSDWNREEGMAGEWVHTAGKWNGDPEDKGLHT